MTRHGGVMLSRGSPGAMAGTCISPEVIWFLHPCCYAPCCSVCGDEPFISQPDKYLLSVRFFCCLGRSFSVSEAYKIVVFVS